MLNIIVKLIDNTMKENSLRQQQTKRNENKMRNDSINEKYTVQKSVNHLVNADFGFCFIFLPKKNYFFFDIKYNVIKRYLFKLKRLYP